MPNIKSQVKRMKKSEEQRERNRAVKSSLKTYIKRFSSAQQSGDVDNALQAYQEAARLLDKAVSKGVIHKNKAANQKSHMARLLNAMH
jgi:small subunit ribosomal protein S20